MWRRVEIRNYRSIEHVKVDLAPFTLIVGPNGSGKSNFVDALLFADEMGSDHEKAIKSRGGILQIKRTSATGEAHVSVDVTSSDTGEFPTSYSYRSNLSVRALSASDWVFESDFLEFTNASGQRVKIGPRQNQTVDVYEDGVRIGVEKIYPLTSLPSLLGQLDARSRAFAWQKDGRSGPSRFTAKNDWDHRGKVKRFHFNPEEMRKGQSPGDGKLSENGGNIALAVRSLASLAGVMEVMERIVPGLTSIQATDAGPVVFLEFRQDQGTARQMRLYADQLSDGALRALGIVVALQQMQPNDLLIFEEPENALHPGAANLLFDILKEGSEKGAILVTTHSPDLLDAASDEEILVCEYRNGATEIGPLSASQKEIVQRGLFSVAEMMRIAPLRREGTALEVIDPAAMQP